MTKTASAAAAAPTVDAVIGRNVEYLIWMARQTQAEVAREMGVTSGALSHKLNGRRPWSAAEISFVANRYRVSIDSLFDLNSPAASTLVASEPRPSDYKAPVPRAARPANRRDRSRGPSNRAR